MKLKELIDYCNDLKESKSRFINCIDVDRIIDTIKQLDEPKKSKFRSLWRILLQNRKNWGIHCLTQ